MLMEIDEVAILKSEWRVLLAGPQHEGFAEMQKKVMDKVGGLYLYMHGMVLPEPPPGDEWVNVTLRQLEEAGVVREVFVIAPNAGQRFKEEADAFEHLRDIPSDELAHRVVTSLIRCKGNLQLYKQVIAMLIVQMREEEGALIRTAIGRTRAILDHCGNEALDALAKQFELGRGTPQ